MILISKDKLRRQVQLLETHPDVTGGEQLAVAQPGRTGDIIPNKLKLEADWFEQNIGKQQ